MMRSSYAMTLLNDGLITRSTIHPHALTNPPRINLVILPTPLTPSTLPMALSFPSPHPYLIPSTKPTSPSRRDLHSIRHLRLNIHNHPQQLLHDLIPRFSTRLFDRPDLILSILFCVRFGFLVAGGVLFGGLIRVFFGGRGLRKRAGRGRG